MRLAERFNMRSGSLVWQTWYLVDTVRLAERFNMRSGSLVWQTWYSIYQFIHCFTLEPCNYYVIFIPPANFVCGGYTVFTLSVCACVCVCVRPSVCPSVTFCFFNILKSHCWIFIKPCKHVHICKTNTLDKKVMARGQFY